MKRRDMIAALAVLMPFASANANTKRKVKPMTKSATGDFDVKGTPLPFDDKAPGVTLGRMRFDKQFRGDLVATSQVEMLSALSSVKGSAAYVAMEWITGTLGSKSGSFVLHHTGVMDRGAQSLAISVVPDSGTGELTGLTGTFKIDIRDGKHFYAFDYVIPA